MKSGNDRIGGSEATPRIRAAVLALLFSCGASASAFHAGETFRAKSAPDTGHFSVITVDHSAILSNPHTPDKPRLTASSPAIKPDAAVSLITFNPQKTERSARESPPRSPLFTFARFSTSTFH